MSVKIVGVNKKYFSGGTVMIAAFKLALLNFKLFNGIMELIINILL